MRVFCVELGLFLACVGNKKGMNMFDNLLSFGYEAILQSSRDLCPVRSGKNPAKPVDMQAAAIKFFELNKLFGLKQKTK